VIFHATLLPDIPKFLDGRKSGENFQRKKKEKDMKPYLCKAFFLEFQIENSKRALRLIWKHF
jgi:hypothetical protein